MKNVKKFMVLSLVAVILITFVPALGAQEGEKININKASVEQIAKLKGIGPKYADRIVQYREEHGPFKTPEDIIKVRGIGPKMFDSNKDRITVE